MEEIWKEIEGFNNYQVSTLGRVRRHNPGKHTYINKILPQGISNCGYFMVTLFANNKRYLKTVHRLVANAFIDNPNNLSDVDHIDNNKLNNNVENLQWLSHKDNIIKRYKYDNGKSTQKIKRTCYLKRQNNPKPTKKRCYIFNNIIFIKYEDIMNYLDKSKASTGYFLSKNCIKRDYVLLLLNGKIQNIEDKYGNSVNIDINNVKFYNNKDKYIYN